MIVRKAKRMIVLPVYLLVQLSAIESAVTVAELSCSLVLYNCFYTVFTIRYKAANRTKREREI